MKLSEFILLSEQLKKDTVMHSGILVGKRKLPGSMIFLFQLDQFYVETWCNQLTKAVEQFQVFSNIKLLSPYLDVIPIDGILKD